MEIATQIVFWIAAFGFAGNMLLVFRSKDVLEEIKHLAWSIFWILSAIGNTLLAAQ